MNINWLSLLSVLLFSLISCSDTELLNESKELYAYHTSLNNSQKPHDRYEDLIVKFDDGQLEFRKDQAYSPIWQVGSQSFKVQDLFPDIELDKDPQYAYVRVLAQEEDQVVVHYKHHSDLSGIYQSIDEDPLYTGGITSVVHEIFTIKKDYSIIRQIKNAQGTRYEDWIHPDFGSMQEIQLKSNGLSHGAIQKGKTAPIYPRSAITGNPILTYDNSGLLLEWNFDEGLEPHNDHVQEEITKTKCFITGLSTHYEKGISGTALAFDGYYTSISLDADKIPDLGNEFSVSAWLAPDAYPYNQVPIIHQSKQWGREGFYFGLDPYGFVFVNINGQKVSAKNKIDFGKWTMAVVSVDEGKASLYLNGKLEGSIPIGETMNLPNVPIQIGRNNEVDRSSDFVREFEQNIAYKMGFQGLLDEIRVEKVALSPQQVKQLFDSSKPDDFTSSLALGVLPGKEETNSFGAYYTDLDLNAIWNNLWRNIKNTDIAVEFEDVKGSVKFWKGTNYASNWITENNIWMADQSTETWGPHGCSEHMSDKQNRQTFARIIENNAARVIIHWKYPCVDIGYINNNDETNWSDEFYYIYPDGTAIRKVNFNGRGLANPEEEEEEEEEETIAEEETEELSEFVKATEEWVAIMEGYRNKYYRPENNTWTEENIGWNGPGFQDVQILVAPGLEALDLVSLNAMDVANLKGEVQQLRWELPNKTPFVQIHDACIELVNTRSEYRTFEIFQGGYITPWGLAENSAHTNDPFAGPWNHWPVNLLPSDGRYAIGNDRIGHFALGGNDALPEVGAMVLHGMTNKSIESLIPLAKSWKMPPKVGEVQGTSEVIYSKEQKAFLAEADAEKLSFKILASKESPIVNPAFVVSNWDQGKTQVLINGKEMSDKDLKIGYEWDARGEVRMVIWLRYKSNEPTVFEISRK